jgi:tRNA(Ile2)-agmatinylcytidine synthase
MLLAIAADGFDTPVAGCTTHFASLLAIKLQQQGMVLADYPWLVRLNPSIPWKTRGNGAVAVYAYVDGTARHGKIDSTVRMVLRLAQRYDVSGKKASLVILAFSDAEELASLSCPRNLYVKALTHCLTVDEVRRCLASELRAYLVAGYGLDRGGVIGAIAALGAMREGDDVTFELLAYRAPEFWGKPRTINPLTVKVFDYATGPYTFANYDYEAGRPLIAPHGDDPVLYGVRGEDPNYLLKALDYIEVEEPITHWTLFRTNQATNIHLDHAPRCSLNPYTVSIVEGRVEKRTLLRGGHVILTVKGCGNAKIHVAVYRETIRLNRVARMIKVNQEVRVYGAVKPHTDNTLTLNAEAIEILEDDEDALAYAVPGTKLIVPSTSGLHHLSKPFERYINERLIGSLDSIKVRKPFRTSTPVAKPILYQ